MHRLIDICISNSSNPTKNFIEFFLNFNPSLILSSSRACANTDDEDPKLLSKIKIITTVYPVVIQVNLAQMELVVPTMGSHNPPLA